MKPIIAQKQPPEVFCKKRCSWKFLKIHRKTRVSDSLFFNKVAGLWEKVQMLSCEFCGIPKNKFLTEYFRTTASERCTQENLKGMGSFSSGYFQVLSWIAIQMFWKT